MKRKIIKIDEEKCNGCGGMTEIVKQTMKKADEIVPFSVHVISVSGEKIN